MTDFLLELRSEEIPARMLDKARADLERLFVAELDKVGLKSGAIATYATPRRLALIARDLPLETQAVSEELKGPRSSAPPQALEGFLRKTGLTQDQLVDRDGVWFAVIEKPGRATADVLAQAIPAIVRGFPWPKSMRWGDASASTESLRWVRPLQGIVAILGETLVPCEIAGIESGYATVGHRFHSPHAITMGGANDYVEKLRACHVIVDQDERRTIIRDHAAALAAEAGLKLIEDEGLVAENAGLTEWPVPLLGRFDPAFLDVPPEAIQLTARVNQKYFVCEGADGKLANAFVCVANIAAKDGGACIVEGNQKVLAARLSDARFFYDTDLKVPLEEQAKKLEKIVFHEKLGTVADKVDRVAKLARWLVEEGIIPLPAGEEGARSAQPSGKVRATGNDADHPHPSAAAPLPPSPAGRGKLADHAERAARLAKADLVTGMVGEFPELQGVMGGYYARAQGEPREVWEAVRDHYKPVGQGDEVPTAPVTVAVSLADKLDTIFSFFIVRERPTGSKDPFALRRAALGILQLMITNKLTFQLRSAYGLAARCAIDRMVNPVFERLENEAQELFHRVPLMPQDFAEKLIGSAEHEARTVGEELTTTLVATYFSVLDFFADRLKVQQREAGVRHDLIDAVFALGNEDDLVRLLARVHALQAFVTTDEGANLLAGYKRAANILKKEGWSAPIAPTSHDVTPAKAGVLGDNGGQEPRETPAFAGVTGAGVGPQKQLSYSPEPAEAALITALDSAEPRAAAAIEREDFEGAMAALASLRVPIDQFFETVIVNDPDPAKRAARLNLLGRMRNAVHTVADFSKIEG